MVIQACAQESPQQESLATDTETSTINKPVFREVAESVGLSFVGFTGATGQYYFPEIAGSGVALLDYDSDGDLDVYLVQGTRLDGPEDPADGSLKPTRHNQLFQNELIPSGNLHFIDVTETAGVGDTGYGMGVTVGDIDNDHDPDLYVTNFGGNVLYRNDGNGRFQDITYKSGADDPGWSTSASFFDFDADGDLDLYVANYVEFHLQRNKRCSGHAGQQDYCGPQNFEPAMDRLLRNDGNGSFTDITTQAGIIKPGPGLGVVAADFNGDERVDIYVANDQFANFLWTNQKDGKFQDTALMAGSAYNASGEPEASMGVTAGDFDGDGDVDLFMTHLVGQTNTLYVNDGLGVFQDVTLQHGLGGVSRPFTGFGARWFDYDNNGTLDLFVANGAVKIERALINKDDYPYGQLDQLFHNPGSGRFEDISHTAFAPLRLLEVGRGAAFGDIDNDGDTDILVSNNNGPAHLLRNEVGNQNHWLQLCLIGRGSNRDGMGARVGIIGPDGSTVWRRAHTDGSYLSANDHRVHFGLGERASPVNVVVVWPSSRQEMWENLAIDRQVTLEEGTGRIWKPAPDLSP